MGNHPAGGHEAHQAPSCSSPDGIPGLALPAQRGLSCTRRLTTACCLFTGDGDGRENLVSAGQGTRPSCPRRARCPARPSRPSRVDRQPHVRRRPSQLQDAPRYWVSTDTRRGPELEDLSLWRVPFTVGKLRHPQASRSLDRGQPSQRPGQS